MWLIIFAKDERGSALHWKQVSLVLFAAERAVAIGDPVGAVEGRVTIGLLELSKAAYHLRPAAARELAAACEALEPDGNLASSVE